MHEGTTKEEYALRRKMWTDALRSGEYAQGHGRLKWIEDGETTHCCLGVACEVFKESLNLVEKKINTECSFSGTMGVLLPYSLTMYLALRSLGGELDADDGLSNSLWKLNDIQRLSFEEIAKVIDSNPPGLFEAGTY
jgi:hypothetical protein